MEEGILDRIELEAVGDYEVRFRGFLEDFTAPDGSRKYIEKIKSMIVEGRIGLVVEFPDLYMYDTRLALSLERSPDIVLPQFNRALTGIVRGIDPDYAEEKGLFHVRLTKLPKSIPIRGIKSWHLNRLVMVEGILVRATPVKEKMVRATYKHMHPECGEEFEWPSEGEVGEVLEAPPYCIVCGRPGNLRLVLEKSRFIDWQKIVIQEKPEDVPPGQIPRSVEAILTRDLVDVARPGDRVSVVGILRVQPGGKRVRPVYDVYLEVVGVDVSQKTLEEIEISREDEQRILELARDPWIRKRVIASIAPGIHGLWDVKEAIALALFGGVPKETQDKMRIRGDIHILLIGDPGTAKSQLLQYVSRIAPRAIYTTGKGSSAAGLTAAVVREKGTGEFYLEAGALVLADGGVALIDEIDKMREEDRVAIHEAMEQQTVSIAKAGIVARLNARCAVIAAGNPRYGRYIEERLLPDNINLPITILSRFDLIFVIKDKPNAAQDSALAYHVLRVHREPEEVVPEIPVDLLKKYISYARRSVRPKLTEQASELLKSFFVEMRRLGSELGEGVVSITTRQLEALVRLAEAHARMALKEWVTEEDAAEAIRLMKTFLDQIGRPSGESVPDIDALMVGKPKSKREKMLLIEDAIKELLSETGEKCVTIRQIGERVKSEGVTTTELEELLSRMLREGIIYEYRAGCFSRTPP
uniref:DNA helicase n=1 Tax=Fervidicoccus fontis TaxID=683846 RepID=A0A7J3ZLT2_9CREN